MIPTIESQVFEQHALEASFLWSAREAAARDPRSDLATLGHADERLEANLDGLRLAGDAGWAACEAGLDDGEAGEIFTAAVVALERGDVGALSQILDLAGEHPALGPGFVSALGWLPFEQVEGFLHALLDPGGSPALHVLGIAAWSAHARDPGPAVASAVASNDLRLRARALRAVGELGRVDQLPELRRALGAADDGCRFAAAWSAALLGEPAATGVLADLAAKGGPHAVEACDMAMRRANPAEAIPWLRGLQGRDGVLRAGLAGAAALGDPAAVPWLLDRLDDPECGRAAGAALSVITGLDLRGQKLVGKAPAGVKPVPSDDPAGDDVEMDPDETLPWPDAAAVRAWWGRAASAFAPGTRHLLGKPLSPSWLGEVLRRGTQPARAAAALELCLRERATPLFDVRAPAFRQRVRLS